MHKEKRELSEFSFFCCTQIVFREEPVCMPYYAKRVAKTQLATILTIMLRHLLNQRDATLDKVGEVLALKHAVREQCEIDNLTYLAVVTANLLEACVALGA